MILLFNNKKIQTASFIPKDIYSLRELERQHELFTVIDSETGFLLYGQTDYDLDEPSKRIERTCDCIKVYVGKNAGGAHMIKKYIPKANITLQIIEKTLEYVPDSNTALKDFFKKSGQIITRYGTLEDGEFNLTDTTDKLNYILKSKKLALSILQDAYLDYFLFATGFLPNVDIKIEDINNTALLANKELSLEANENTELLNIAQEFAKIKRP